MTIRIYFFEWDEHNSRHIEFHPDHPVSKDIVEELFTLGDFKIRKTRQGRYISHGRHLDGYYLVVIFENKGGGTIRPVSARKMEDREKKLYWRK